MPICGKDCLHLDKVEERFSVFFQFSLLFYIVFIPSHIQYISYIHGTV